MAAESKNSRSQSRLEKAAREDEKVRVRYEVEARSVAEKTARVACAALGHRGGRPDCRRQHAGDRQEGQSGQEAPPSGESLSEWLADQDKMGRRG